MDESDLTGFLEGECDIDTDKLSKDQFNMLYHNCKIELKEYLKSKDKASQHKLRDTVARKLLGVGWPKAQEDDTEFKKRLAPYEITVRF